MRWETLPIDELKPAPYNPRKPLRRGMPAYERLRRSLEEFELVQPIVWNRRTGHVVGGHQRVQILRDRGDTRVQCVVVDLSPEREKALNIALNNSQVGGTWDNAKLVDLVAELQQLPDFDATLTGFDAADLKHLLLAPEPMSPETDADGQAADRVRVTLDVPADDWDDVRAALDDCLVEHPGVRVHVQPPSRG